MPHRDTRDFLGDLSLSQGPSPARTARTPAVGIRPGNAGRRDIAGFVHRFGAIWGHWVGCAFLQGRSLVVAAAIGLAIAASLHGLYDFVVILNPHNTLPIAALGIVAIWVWRLKLMQRLHKDASQTR